MPSLKAVIRFRSLEAGKAGQGWVGSVEKKLLQIQRTAVIRFFLTKIIFPTPFFSPPPVFRNMNSKRLLVKLACNFY